MAMSAQLMASMDDDHLVAALLSELDPMTSTAAEQELLSRLEGLLDQKREVKPLDDALATSEVLPEEIPAVLSTMSEFSCYDAGDLRAKLERADKFYSIAQEAGDAFSRLNDLVNNTL